MSDTATRGDGKTVADYEAFVASRPEEERWELIAGVITMMTNPYLNHGLIVGNLFAPLKLRLDGGECRAIAGGLRVQRSEDRGEDFAAIPDLVAFCGPRANRTFIVDPVAVVEVLSRSTMDHDRSPKLAFYKGLATLHHIALVYQDQMRVEHYRRTAEGWSLGILTRGADALAFDRLGFTIDLDALYFDVPILRSVEPAGPFEPEPEGPVR